MTPIAIKNTNTQFVANPSSEGVLCSLSYTFYVEDQLDLHELLTATGLTTTETPEGFVDASCERIVNPLASGWPEIDDGTVFGMSMDQQDGKRVLGGGSG